MFAGNMLAGSGMPMGMMGMPMGFPASGMFPAMPFAGVPGMMGSYPAMAAAGTACMPMPGMQMGMQMSNAGASGVPAVPAAAAGAWHDAPAAAAAVVAPVMQPASAAVVPANAKQHCDSAAAAAAASKGDACDQSIAAMCRSGSLASSSFASSDVFGSPALLGAPCSPVGLSTDMLFGSGPLDSLVC
jgi:hypothetical protein